MGINWPGVLDAIASAFLWGISAYLTQQIAGAAWTDKPSILAGASAFVGALVQHMRSKPPMTVAGVERQVVADKAVEKFEAKKEREG